MKGARKRTAPTHRYLATALAFLVAAMSGVALTFWFSSGLRAGRYLSDDGIGRVEALRLPIGARRYADVKSFVIGMGSADDYGRVYLNNYVVLNRGNRPALRRPGYATQSTDSFGKNRRPKG
jgi:hypothetical protein